MNSDSQFSLSPAGRYAGDRVSFKTNVMRSKSSPPKFGGLNSRSPDQEASRMKLIFFVAGAGVGMIFMAIIAFASGTFDDNSSSNSGNGIGGATAVPTLSPTLTGATAVPTIDGATAAPTAISANFAAASPGEAVVAVPAGIISITSCPNKQLCVLVRESDSQAIARSYDGNTWESSAASGINVPVVNVACAEGKPCTLVVPGEGSFHLAAYSRSTSSVQETSRFLTQATFGATRESISTWPGSAKTWIAGQMTKAASLHRSYYRERVNTRTYVVNPTGRARLACESGSRWRGFAFTFDDNGKTIVATAAGGKVSLAIDGVKRTEVATADWNVGNNLKPYVVCTVKEQVGGAMTFGAECAGTAVNPTVTLSASPAANLVTVTTPATLLVPLALDIPNVKLLKLDLAVPSQCTLPNESADKMLFVNTDGNNYLIHDTRIVIEDNTMESPMVLRDESLGPSLCANVPKSFVNIKSCVIQRGEACEPLRTPTALFTLTDSVIVDFYELANSFVYTITGLKLDKDDLGESPCSRPKSRWQKYPGTCGATSSNNKLSSATTTTLVELLVNSQDKSTKIRDIVLPGGAVCDVTKDSIGARLDINDPVDGSVCWHHVHSDLLNVFDFSYWARVAHPGNADAEAGGRPNPIMKPAMSGEAITYKSRLFFPIGHGFERWTENRKYFTFIGRFGDVVEFSSLPTNLQTEEMAAKVGAVVESGVAADQVYGEMCGSPGEVANNPAHGSRFAILQTFEDDVKPEEGRLDQTISQFRVKSTVWNMITMYGQDQLRQRMAWALSQILVVTAEEVDEEDTTEHFLKYYDIFVRHAFGNYRDVLKEVSFSPMMGEMLSYMGSEAFQFQDREIFPDENYAREIMQLFSIGLWKLNNDGTPVLDSQGLPVATYNNDEITTFSRAWTGFSKQALRGNVESPYGAGSFNKVDPMRLEGHKRDVFPKRDLHGGYIGDRYPLCVDEPERRFLRKGATYRFLGSSPLPREQRDPTNFGETAGGIKRVELTSGQSALYAALCNASPSDPNSVCRYQSEVVLDSNLACHGQECEIDTARVVALSVTGKVFFEYIRPPCVQLPFFSGGKKLQTKAIAGAADSASICADPRMAVGAEACCSTAGSTSATQDCNYHGERLTFTSTQERCASKAGGAQSTCDFTTVFINCAQETFFTNMWTNAECNVQAKVSKKGRVAIVHDTPAASTRKLVLPATKNFFRVLWGNDKTYPLVSNANCGAGCAPMAGDEAESCLCSATVVERVVFSSRPTRGDILARLHIGSVAPSVNDPNSYSQATGADTANDVKTYIRTGGVVFDIDTIFEVIVNGKVVFLRNMESEVQLGGGVHFRNPPHFMDFVDSTTRDALHETDAVLDNYLYHPNTAPFLAYRFIQRFVGSNPSPRYIDTVATAFRTGTYDGFGSGEYGDLAATIAAVLLDREARSTELDLEPANGKLREPLLKVIQFMRSLELEPRDRHELELGWLEDTIGMNAHQAPNVFSFFQPEYSPAGPIQNAVLVSPESQVLTSPNIVNFLNGMSSMAKYDLTDCSYGFSQNYGEGRCVDPRTKAIANLKFAPNTGASASDVVNELDMLLTTGRLDPTARDVMVEEYTAILAENGGGNTVEALRHLYQLFAVTPEFHTTNVNTRTNLERPVAPEQPNKLPASTKYKAVVYLFLAGAADSFNILVPHSQCPGKDLNAEYSTVRGNAALNKDALLQIAVPAGTQPCDVFGLHPKLPSLKQSYDQGQVAFFANVGPLVEPVTKAGWDSKEAKLPKSLFAHNVQQKGVQSVEPEGAVGTGVLGRISDQLTTQGYSMGSYSVTGNSHALTGRAPRASPPQDIIDSLGGIVPFDEYPSSARILPAVNKLTGSTTSLFGETWSATVQNMLGRTKELGTALKTAEVLPFPKTGLGIQFEQVAKLVKTHSDLGTNRDVFHVQLGGFDTHTNLEETLTLKMEEIDAALEAFKNEMVAQGVWDDVVVVTASDFGRTLTSNGAGTDHAWGGNYWMMGGKVNGTRIHGDYPDDLTSNGQLNIGRGRLIPTTSWEGVWNGIATWFGVATDGIEKVLPNIGKFPVESLLTRAELFV